MPTNEWAHEAGVRAWTLEAACGKGVGPTSDEFHSTSKKTAEAAARFCIAYCTVRDECLEDALRREEQTGSRWGVWGGYTATGRRKLAAERQRAAVAPVIAGSVS